MHHATVAHINRSVKYFLYLQERLKMTIVMTGTEKIIFSYCCSSFSTYIFDIYHSLVWGGGGMRLYHAHAGTTPHTSRKHNAVSTCGAKTKDSNCLLEKIRSYCLFGFAFMYGASLRVGGDTVCDISLEREITSGILYDDVIIGLSRAMCSTFSHYYLRVAAVIFDRTQI